MMLQSCTSFPFSKQHPPYMVEQRIIKAEHDPNRDELLRLEISNLYSKIRDLKKQNKHLNQKTHDTLENQKYYMKYKLTEAEQQSTRYLRDENDALKHQVTKLNREKDDLQQEVRDLRKKTEDLKFFLSARDQSTDNIVPVIYTVQEHSSTMNDILEFDSYWHKLSSNLLIFGYEECINNFSHFNSTQPLVDPDEEKLVFCVLQATVGPKYNHVFKSHRKDASPSVGVLIDLNSRSIAAKEELLSSLKLRMSTLRICSSSKKDRALYFKEYNDIFDDINKYQLTDDIPANTVIRNAYFGVRSSEDFSEWATSYEESISLSPDQAYKTFGSLNDLDRHLKGGLNVDKSYIILGCLSLFFIIVLLFLLPSCL